MKEEINFMNIADMFIDKINALPRFVDRDVESMKTSVVRYIPGLVNKFASKLSVAMFLVYTIYFFVYCIIICISYGRCDEVVCSLATGTPIVAIIGSYIIYKMMGSFDRIISSSPCRISSMSIFSIMVVVFKYLCIFSVIAGIVCALLFQAFVFVIYGICSAAFFYLLALYNSAPEEFAIVLDEKSSTGEDLIAIITFAVKVELRLVPIATFLLPIIGMCMDIISPYSLMMQFVILSFVGMLPLISYFYYLINYIVLDIIRVVLSLPKKFDELRMK